MKDEALLARIVIRSFGGGDEERIEAFFDQMGGESRSLFNRRDYNRRGVLKYCRKPDPTRRYYMAELDGEMAGYVFFLDWNTTIPELGIAVRDDLAGRGLGRRLMEYAVELVLREGKGGIQLTTHVANLRAQTLYESVGFTCMGLCKNGTELAYLFRYRQEHTEKQDIS